MDESVCNIANELSQRVLAKGEIVTAAYVLRHTSLDVRAIQDILTKFLEVNRTDERVNATYFLYGEMVPKDGQEADGITRKASLICRQQDLKRAKAKFLSLQVCNIHSVQAKPMQSLQLLQNMGWENDYGAEKAKMHTKTLVKSSQAVEAFDRWIREENETKCGAAASVDRSPPIERTDSAKSKLRSSSNLTNSVKIKKRPICITIREDEDDRSPKYTSATPEARSPIQQQQITKQIKPVKSCSKVSQSSAKKKRPNLKARRLEDPNQPLITQFYKNQPKNGEINS